MDLLKFDFDGFFPPYLPRIEKFPYDHDTVEGQVDLFQFQ